MKVDKWCRLVQVDVNFTAMNQEKPPPTCKLVRTTISVRPEVLEKFRQLSSASGVSLSKAIGDWLFDTVDAADTMTQLLVDARRQPLVVARQLQGYAMGLSDMTNDLLDELRARPTVKVTPPVGNTGGKLPKQPKNRGG